jgi:hypothetical protein
MASTGILRVLRGHKVVGEDEAAEPDWLVGQLESDEGQIREDSRFRPVHVLEIIVEELSADQPITREVTGRQKPLDLGCLTAPVT